MTKIKVCALDEIPVGTGRRVPIQPGWDIGVFRTSEGVRAIDNMCPHAGAALHHGHMVGDDILCPLHMWAFSLTTGKCTSFLGPSVETFPTEIVEGTVYLLLDMDAMDGDNDNGDGDE